MRAFGDSTCDGTRWPVDTSSSRSGDCRRCLQQGDLQSAGLHRRQLAFTDQATDDFANDLADERAV